MKTLPMPITIVEAMAYKTPYVETDAEFLYVEPGGTTCTYHHEPRGLGIERGEEGG